MTNREAKFNLLNNSVADDDHSHNSIADHSNYQSAELIGYNVDLLTKIFVCLPGKSILRFKAVSKPWLSLLTHLLTHDPRFSLLFDKLLISSGLYYRELNVSYDVTNPTTPPFRSLDFSPDTSGIRIVQSCNGLLLCRCDGDYYSSRNYYVYNPTTKKSALIPPVIGGSSAESLIRFMGLAYHPTECVHYKLVCILRAGYTHHGEGFSEDGDRMYKIQIYYSHTGKWKKLKKRTFTPSGYTQFRYGVYWNGAFHWGPTCPNPMYLSLDDEQLKELPLPSSLPVEGGYYCYFRKLPLYFGESRGHLHLVEYSHEKNPSGVNVYEMLRDHSGWFIKYQLDLHQTFDAYPNMTHTYSHGMFSNKYEFKVLDVVRSAEEEEENDDTFMVVKVIDNIRRYNILDKSFQELCDVPNLIEENYPKSDFKTFHCFVGHRYIEKIGSF
ncbi:F-box protein At5g07610-like [Rutidosis leptorrhynchoides]|uniref:F-box protein At5g07610-like n=1 Tax=Rutidosis leptorrhynchoides TaxID=125765 RepID=UPI003A99A6FE